MFFCERSDYFRARVEDNFGESYTKQEDDRQLQVVPLAETTCSVFVQILYYVYQDSCLQVGEGGRVGVCMCRCVCVCVEGWVLVE